ncbi:hypothetical protein [Roseovarius mucosus]|uniref:hypothetical protein n=1 Tax=Roseovarius mucosus TaxID=215743 RepID=UPI003BAC1D33
MPINFDSLAVDDECLARINAALEKNRLWLNSLPREDLEDPDIYEFSVIMRFSPALGRLTYVQSTSGNYLVDDVADMVF